jgi:hypothetical protein
MWDGFNRLEFGCVLKELYTFEFCGIMGLNFLFLE